MKKEAARSPLDILNHNLEENARSLLREEEKRLGSLYEAAEITLDALFSQNTAEDPLSLLLMTTEIREGLPPSLPSPPKHPLPDNRRALAALRRKISAEDRIGFTESFLSLAEARFGRPFTLSDFPEGVQPPPEGARVLYVKNPYADLSFDAFSRLLPLARPGIRDSFRTVCDDLENGYGDYAILPISSGGRMLPPVSSLLTSYGFSIAALVHLLTEDEEAPVFALLSRTPITLSEPHFFGFRFFPKSDEELHGLLSALDRFGIKIKRLETLPTATHPAFGAVVAGDERKFVLLLSYLTLFLKDFSGFGFFSEMKKGIKNS